MEGSEQQIPGQAAETPRAQARAACLLHGPAVPAAWAACMRVLKVTVGWPSPDISVRVEEHGVGPTAPAGHN